MKEDARDLKLIPDHFVYAIMLKVVRAHTERASEERRRWVETLFDDACDSGQVSLLVIRDLREACPGVDLFERLVARNKSSPNTAVLPRSWTRNVRGSKRIRTVELSASARSTSVSRQTGDNRRRRAVN